MAVRPAKPWSLLVQVQVQNKNIHTNDSMYVCCGNMMIEKSKTEFKDVLTGDSCLEGEFIVEIVNSVLTVKLPNYRLPVAMVIVLKGKLKDFEKREIIALVEHRTDWTGRKVSVTKWNRKLRNCIDP